MEISYTITDSPLDRVLVAATDKGICVVSAEWLRIPAGATRSYGEIAKRV